MQKQIETKTRYICLTEKQEFDHINDSQTIALELLPKLEKFCIEYGLGCDDIRNLYNMLLDKQNAIPLKEK